MDISIEPDLSEWPARLADARGPDLFGRAIGEWCGLTRAELGLDQNRPIIATGHQTLLWHPGILAKYLAAQACSQASGLATANLVVDQHAEGFGDFEIPARRSEGSLAVRRLHLTTPRKGVPMGLHEPFTPLRPPALPPGVLPSVAAGVNAIYDAVYAHRDAPNAARQMARALQDLMAPWVAPLPVVTSSDLLGTTFARALLAAMAADPAGCAGHYNEAVRSLPEAGIGELLVRDDYIELPLWRVRDDGRRMHAYDNDVQAWLEGSASRSASASGGDHAPVLMPRALLLTALVRLGMCDLFIHGRGGANYDRAMERWIGNWLGVRPAAIAMVTADVRLPLGDDGDVPVDADAARGNHGWTQMGAVGGQALDVERARARFRRLWHDPLSGPGPHGGPSDEKSDLLEAIDEAPRRSPARRAAFHRLHEALEQERRVRSDSLAAAEASLERTRMQAANLAIAARRDWAFPLYPVGLIDDLAAAIREHAVGRPADRAVPAR
jgi:hypothetical protein